MAKVLVCLGLIACADTPRPVVVVVGGGPAGLSAAIEASAAADVIVVEKAPRLGGSAVYAGAITAVPGPAGGGALPPVYASNVRSEVVEWTRALGQEWVPADNPLADGLVLTKPEGGGQALIQVLTTAARERAIDLRVGTGARSLRRESVWVLELDSGQTLRADAVVVATGGFSGSLQRVRAALGGEGPLLRGAPRWADGSGSDMIIAAGGHAAEPARVLTYGHGVPKPEEPDRALMIVSAPGGRWLDRAGRKIIPRTVRGEGGRTLWNAPGGGGWLVLDQASLGGLQLRDPMIDAPIDALAVLEQAGWLAADLVALKTRDGLSGDALNLLQCPCAALPIYPTTGKSLSGVVSDSQGRVLDSASNVIPGLYSAGEVAGFGFGPHPAVDSTMVAGAILSGRVAGRAAARPR